MIVMRSLKAAYIVAFKKRLLAKFRVLLLSINLKISHGKYLVVKFKKKKVRKMLKFLYKHTKKTIFQDENNFLDLENV